jgi:Taurine catabolism dioxygenase TauD, TfdA family
MRTISRMASRQATVSAADVAATAGAELVARLRSAPYFVVVDGFAGDDETIRRDLVDLCASLGTLRRQDREGGTVGEVRADGGGPARGARTTNALLWHTDTIFDGPPPELVGLCAVRTAPDGGVSRLVTADDLVAELRRRYPQHLQRLREPFLFNRADYVDPSDAPYVAAPILDFDDPDAPTVLYNRARIHRGHQLAGMPLTADDRDALDALDDVLESAETPRTDLLVHAGSALFFRNGRLLHNRTAYREDPSAPRLLYRVWIDSHERVRASAGGSM